MENKECIICGKSFTPKSHNSLVCSDECRDIKLNADRREMFRRKRAKLQEGVK